MFQESVTFFFFIFSVQFSIDWCLLPKEYKIDFRKLSQDIIFLWSLISSVSQTTVRLSSNCNNLPGLIHTIINWKHYLITGSCANLTTQHSLQRCCLNLLDSSMKGKGDYLKFSHFEPAWLDWFSDRLITSRRKILESFQIFSTKGSDRLNFN